MARTIADVVKRVEERLKGELGNTSEHQGFVTALRGVIEELGSRSPVLECGDDRAVLAIDREELVQAIGVELERPVGKVKMAEKIADALGNLIGVHALTVEEEVEEEVEEGHPTGKNMARGVIGRFDDEVRPPGGGDGGS